MYFAEHLMIMLIFSTTIAWALREWRDAWRIRPVTVYDERVGAWRSARIVAHETGRPR